LGPFHLVWDPILGTLPGLFLGVGLHGQRPGKPGTPLLGANFLKILLKRRGLIWVEKGFLPLTFFNKGF